MREIEYVTKKLIPITREEKDTAKSWGPLWSRFGVLERTGRPILLIFGDWSGYTSRQYRITHVDFATNYGVQESYRATVQFTDNTTMSVWVQRVTRREILEKGFSRKQNYNDLIRKAARSGESFYKV